MVAAKFIPKSDRVSVIEAHRFMPSRWWFLKMFLFGIKGITYWYEPKYVDILIYRKKNEYWEENATKP